MCLGIAGRVVALVPAQPDLARVDVQGVERDVNVALLDGLAPGDWVLIHLGFAMERLTEQQAHESLTLLAALAEGGEVSGFGPGPAPGPAGPRPPADPPRRTGAR